MMLAVPAGWHVHLDILSDQLRGMSARPVWSNNTLLDTGHDRFVPVA
jgi:hypothetical protein